MASIARDRSRDGGSSTGRDRPPVLSLPVLSLDQKRDRAETRSRRLARLRAGIMIGVYILMTAHILHWAITGRSLRRFVMSDSMETLANGRVNPGFLLFAVAIGVSMVAGRFLCGWLCHMGALQELCAWLLKKVGIRPRMFRSRVLGYVPVAMALMMFVWPTLSREAVEPLVRGQWPETAAAHFTPVPPITGWRLDLRSEHLWDGLPPLVVAIPFLLLCGFGTVYFLGARGLCRYACPYGGLMQPLERLAPVRVVVDMDRCTQCGLCTAACTAQVRVHEEVRDYGRVVSRDCVRSLDCIAACPEDALRLAWTRPAFTRPGPTGASVGGWQPSLWGELGLLAVGLWTFLVVRGLYGAIPMLMAATIAVLTGFAAWRFGRALRERDGRLGGMQLKRLGRWTWGGRTFAALVALGAVVLVHSTAVRVMILAAGRLDDRVTVPVDAALSANAPPIPGAMRADAERALRLYRLASGPHRGGVALADTPAVNVRIAYLLMVLGRPDEAEKELVSIVEQDPTVEPIAVQLAGMRLARGDVRRAEEGLTEYLRRRASAASARELLGQILAGSGRVEEAMRLHQSRLETTPNDVGALASLARLEQAMGRSDRAVELLQRATKIEPGVCGLRLEYAGSLFQAGRVDDALAEVAVAARDPRLKDTAISWGEGMLRAANREGEARTWRERLGR